MPERRTDEKVKVFVIALALACAAANAQSTPSDDVVVQALALLGTPYRYGGSSPATGFDCSGLVRHVFAEAARQELPRRSEEMQRFGQPVARRDLQPGDLVFFNTSRRAFSHVAIYIGEGRFVHAPAGSGVVRIEGLDDRYWAARFDGARRLTTSGLASAVSADRGAIAPGPWKPPEEAIRP
jgi:cell wall-associated NlpC family hydrolase